MVIGGIDDELVSLCMFVDSSVTVQVTHQCLHMVYSSTSGALQRDRYGLLQSYFTVGALVSV